MAKKKTPAEKGSKAQGLLAWTSGAWEDYLYWQQTDTGILDRINALIKDCMRDPFHGLGKPEPLRGDLSGFWSRRITDEHRLVYVFEGGELTIIQCRYHY